jgi:hypothetical protein
MRTADSRENLVDETRPKKQLRGDFPDRPALMTLSLSRSALRFRSCASIMSRRARQLALITRGVGRWREARHSVAPGIHALRVHRLVWHPPLRGGILPADRLGRGCLIVPNLAASLRAYGVARDGPEQDHREAGILKSSARPAILIDGG